MSDFSNALRCQPPPKPIKSTGRAPRPASATSALVAARLRAGRALLSGITGLITRSNSRLPRTNGFAERELLRARIDQARALRSTFAYLGNRAEQARIARLSDKQQVDLLAARQREYMRQVRSISSAALRSIAVRLGRAGNREGAQILNRAGAGAAAGRLDVLQATGQPLDVTPQPGGPDTQIPSPGGPDTQIPSPGVPPAGAPPGVPPLPNPTPAPIPKPDLVVPLVVSLVYRDEPLGCTVNYRRGNEGTVAAGASTTSVQLASPGQVTLTSTIAAVPLAPGQSQQESIVFPGINCDPDVYEVTATVTADSTNAVDESSETNNSRSQTFAPG